jgi:hypothetical protein
LIKKQLADVMENYTSCLALLNTTQYELENYQCPEIPECPKSRIYDVNRDGTIDFSDVQIVLNYIGKKHSNFNNAFTGYHLLYDVNVDQKVDMTDAEDIWANRDS